MSSDKDKARAVAYYYTHREEISAKRKVYRRGLTAKGYDKARRLRVKTRVMLHYSLPGSTEPNCVMCGFSDIRALSIDHINGGGTQDRLKNKNMTGGGMYQFLSSSNFPDGYQTLCMNCQFIKRAVNNEAVGPPDREYTSGVWRKNRVYGSGGKKR